VLAETGEIEVFYDSEITDLKFGDREIDYDSVEQCQACWRNSPAAMPAPTRPMTRRSSTRFPEERRRSARGIEVGQIFYFGTKYSEPMGATVVGPTAAACRSIWAATASAFRALLGAIIEANHDDKGIIWPEGVTPFHVGIVNLKQGDAPRPTMPARRFTATLKAQGLDPLYDDRDERAGRNSPPWT
jgi:prolyl-tRNA synthetase